MDDGNRSATTSPARTPASANADATPSAARSHSANVLRRSRSTYASCAGYCSAIVRSNSTAVRGLITRRSHFQFLAQHLAGLVARQVVDRGETGRNLVRRECVSTPCAQLLGVHS